MNLQQKAAVAKRCCCTCEVYLSPMRRAASYPGWRLRDRARRCAAREPIVLRVGWLLKPEYDWHNHVGYALNLACRATKSPR